MSDKSTAEESQALQYSLGQPSVRTGIGGLSASATIVLGIGGLLFLFLSVAGKVLFAALFVVPLTIIVAALVSVRIGSRSLIENIVIMVSSWRKRSRSHHKYLAGPLSRIPGGKRRLPGLFARTEAVGAIDSDGREFVALLDRARKVATVVFDCQLTGQTAQTQEERNRSTAEWSRWLAELSLSGDVRQAVTVVGSRPGTGNIVAREVAELGRDDSPEVAQRIMREAAGEISVGIPDIVSHIAITFDVDDVKDDRFVEQLATRIPLLTSSLSWAGIIAEPMNEEQAVARIHSFYNPAAEADFEELHMAGKDHGISWDDAGPTVAVADRSVYRHDGCYSVTWEMREGPRSTFEDRVLTGLIQPHPRIIRKRVALVYRPFEAGTGARKVEDEHRDAMVALNSSKAVKSASAEMRLEHTDAARRAQARGAQLGRYSLWVTATLDNPDDLERTWQEISHLAASSSVRVAPIRDQQDVGFAVTCGFGEVPWRKQTTKRASLQFSNDQ